MPTSFQKVVIGQKALKVYHEQSMRFPSWRFRDFATFLEHIESGMAPPNIRNPELLGSVIGDLHESKYLSVMRNMAESHKGALPAKFSDLMRPFTDPSKLQNWSTWTTIKTLVAETPGAIGETAQGISSGVVTSLKIGSYVAPVVLVLVGGFLLFQHGGGSISEIKKALKK